MYTNMRNVEWFRKECEKLIENEVEHFQIQLYKGSRCYTVGTAYDSMVEAANTMTTWAEAIDADKGHVINDLTGEIVIYF